ncbi:MAG: SDR family oxidoreductase [Proteobacteria bacterium]|nr:SDR family oxidoreductase [Pseudomonadota bacterium]
MAKVLVTGATGLLGTTLSPFLRARGHHVTQLGHTLSADLNPNLVSHEQTALALDWARPEVIINLVSLTNVDRCETHPQEAYELNVKPVENVCSWIRKTAETCHLIQISSDQVYDGAGPHSEGELTIRNHYAMSKLAGEFAAMTVPSTILRTNFIGRSQSERRRSFTDWVFEGLRNAAPLSVFDDVLFSPLAVHTLCDLVERSVVEKPLGIFNLGSRDGMSKADLAFAFADAAGLRPTSLMRTSASSVATLVARRPKDMRMNCQRFEGLMGLKLPQLIDEIGLIANDYS